MKKIMIRSLLLSILLSISTLYANESGELKQKVRIYGWLPTLNGSATFSVPGEPDESSDLGIIDSLDAVFMGSYGLRKDEWSFLADFIYLKISGDTPGLRPGVNLDIEFTAKLYSLYGGYNLLETETTDLNFIGGLRYFGLGLDVKRSGGLILNRTFSLSVDNYDAVIGVSGMHNIDENWYIPYLFDIGTGDSDLTYQANLSIAYRLSWGDIIGTYRYIHYEKDGYGLVDDFDMYGPKIGVVFHF